MANQTTFRDPQRQQAEVLPYLVGAVDLYAGCGVSVADATGYAKGMSDTAADKFVGVLDKTVKNATGAAGAKDARVWTVGSFTFIYGGTATQAIVGEKAYAVDNQTVAVAAITTADILVGTIVEFINATTVRVKISPDASA